MDLASHGITPMALQYSGFWMDLYHVSFSHYPHWLVRFKRKQATPISGPLRAVQLPWARWGRGTEPTRFPHPCLSEVSFTIPEQALSPASVPWNIVLSIVSAPGAQDHISSEAKDFKQGRCLQTSEPHPTPTSRSLECGPVSSWPAPG
jgi:hypothetical protein